MERRIIMRKLDAESGSACVTLSVHSNIINEGRSRRRHFVSWRLVDLHMRSLRVTPEAYGRKLMPIYLGSNQRLSSSFTWTASVWLPEETWTWELGAIQSIRFTHSSMCLPTCWVEPGRPDEEAIPPRSIIKGKCLPPSSMCCKLRCSHFLQEETEQVMMQIWNV